jgi:hypothetical protein
MTSVQAKTKRIPRIEEIRQSIREDKYVLDAPIIK